MAALRNLSARRAKERADRTDWILPTDAATETSTIAAAIFDREQFKTNEETFDLTSSKTGQYRDTLSLATNRIYGLEMLALLAKRCQPNGHLRNCNATFRIANSDAFDAAVKNKAKPTVIADMAQLIRHRINGINITAWFEWVSGGENIADLPTRGATFAFKCARNNEFKNIR